MTTEVLELKITLSGTYWDRRPVYSVFLDDICVRDHVEISGASDEPETVTISQEIAEGPHVLSVRLENKTDSDTVQSEDKTRIERDLLLNIHSVEIDEINLGNIPFEQGVLTTDNPVVWAGEETQTVPNCLNIGWNGAWRLKFESPVYIWLLENI
jgi:hypothetical protein